MARDLALRELFGHARLPTERDCASKVTVTSLSEFQAAAEASRRGSSLNAACAHVENRHGNRAEANVHSCMRPHPIGGKGVPLVGWIGKLEIACRLKRK